MKFLKDYWFLIVFFMSFIGTSAVGQYRLGHVESVIDKTSDKISKESSKIILLVKSETDKVSVKAEKDYSENKKEIEKLKSEQKNQTVLQINQRYIREDMQELKSLVKDLANEIRRSK